MRSVHELGGVGLLALGGRRTHDVSSDSCGDKRIETGHP